LNNPDTKFNALFNKKKSPKTVIYGHTVMLFGDNNIFYF
jgi:hypothetical protein